MNVQTLDSVSTAAVTELALIRLRSMPDLDAAAFLDARLRCLEADYKRSFVERGLILIEVQERSLWRLLGDYHSFEQWVVTCAPHSRSDCFAAMKACRELREIPREQLADIPRCNISLLQSLSSSVRTAPEVVEAAQTMSEKDFRETIRDAYPDQHLSARRRLILDFDEDDYATVTEALTEIGQALEADGLSGALLAWVIDWRQERQA